MAFTIEFSERARRDLHEIVQYIHRDSPAAATRWRRKLLKRLSVLESMAPSFGLAPENEFTRCEVRQLLFGRYRILYTVRHDVAFILTIRHGAREFASADELDASDTRE